MSSVPLEHEPIVTLSWTPFDDYKDDKGHVKKGAEDYFHPPLLHNHKTPFDDNVEVDQITLQKFSSGENLDQPDLLGEKTKPPLIRGGSILALGEKLEKSDSSESEAPGGNPFLSPTFTTPETSGGVVYDPDQWDFFLDNSKEQKKKEREQSKTAKPVSPTTKKQPQKDTKKSPKVSTQRPKEGDDAGDGVLKITIMEGKGFPEGNHKVMLFIADSPSRGKVKSDVGFGTEPSFFNLFFVHIWDKKHERVRIQVLDEHDSIQYICTINARGLSPQQRRSIWLPLDYNGEETDAEIHVSVKWSPRERLPSIPNDRTRVRLRPRLVIKLDKHIVKAGESITGKVKLLVGTAIYYKKGISVNLMGQEHLSFYTLIRSQSTGLKEHRDFLQKSVVLERNSSKSPKLWKAGYYSWNFKMDIPVDTPPGYAARCGFIRYVVTASVDSDRTLSYTLPVQIHTPFISKISPIDKNQIAKESSLRHVTIRVELEKWIHTLGTSLPLKVIVDNRSKHVVGTLKIRIFERVSVITTSGKFVVSKRVLVSRLLRAVCGIGKTSEREFNVLLPKKYNQQSIMQSMGSKHFRVDHYILIKSGKDAVVRKHKQVLQVPLVLVH